MAIISYFPSAGGLKKIFEYGDIVTLNSLKYNGTTYGSTYYSDNHLLSTTDSMFSQIKSYITYINFPECITIGDYTFRSGIIQKAILPKCVTISSSAFYNTQLSYIDAPNCTTLGSYAFTGCSLIHFNLPNLSEIHSGAFMYATLYSFNFNNISTIPSGCFVNATFNFSELKNYNVTTISSSAFKSLNFSGSVNFYNVVSFTGQQTFSGATITGINMPKMTNIINTQTFFDCNNLSFAYLPKAAGISNSAFNYCNNLVSTNFDGCRYIRGLSSSYHYAGPFLGCSNLTTLSFPNLETISGGYIFSGCIKLQSIYLMASSVCTLNDWSTFDNSPIKVSSYLGYFGSIYVPSSLLTAYQTATNWKAISSRIVGI